MKRTLLLILSGLLILAISSCGNKEKSKLPDKKDRVTEFATIPSFKAMFLALDTMQNGIGDKVSENDLSKAEQDTMHLAFSWGILSADALLAVRSHDKKLLSSLTTQMIVLAPKIGLKDIAIRLKDSILPMIRQGNWSALESTFYNMQYAVEQELFGNKKYEFYSIVTLAGWTETTNHLATMIGTDYSAEKSKVLLQTDAWKSLADNLNLIKTKTYLDAQDFQTAVKQIQNIRNILNAQKEGTYTKEQIAQLGTLTENIKAAFFDTTK